MENNNICVYQHVRLDTNEVFYIGIGNEYRPYDIYNRNKWWKNIVNKTDYRVDILFDDLTWEEACEKEKEFIQLYGRRDLGLGTLVNMTDGGDGSLGLIPSEETKQKISEALKGRIFNDEHKQKLSERQIGEKNHFYGETLSEEHKQKLSKALKGKKRGPMSDETKLKMSLAKKGKKRKPFSDEHKLKLSIAAKNNNKLSINLI